jgi:hypothetical protein
LPVALLRFAVTHAESAPDPAADPAREAVVAALATGGDIPGQAKNLVNLAWPAGKRDEAVADRARRELAHFGHHGMGALRTALNTVKIGWTEEVVETILEARRAARVDMAQQYIVAILDALWVGSRGAKALAIQALSVDRNVLAVAPMIDSAIADPSLAPQVVEALGAMRYQQARFYHETVMMEGPPPTGRSRHRPRQIGGGAQPSENAEAPSRRACWPSGLFRGHE